MTRAPDPERTAAWVAYAVATAIGSLAGFGLIGALVVHGFGLEWHDLGFSATLCFGVWLGDVLRGPRR